MPEQLNQISSLRTPDAQVTRATRPRRFKFLHLPLILVTVLLVVYGLLVVYAATSFDSEKYSFSRQLMGVVAGTIAMVALWRVDYRIVSNMTMPLLVITLLLILSPLVPGLGTDAGMGARCWINVGIQLQPGEFAKITVILLDASVLARYGGRLNDAREYLKALGCMMAPFVAIMLQPDLGTGLVYLFIGAVVLVVGGARLRYLLITLGALVALVALVFAIDQLYVMATGSSEYLILKQYQRDRLLVFLNQDGYNSDEGYNLRQAMIAIGSGGLFGKGWLNASQSALGFLPESSTDFIFCVLAEQFGFVGSIVLLALYLALLLICCRIARSAGDLFGTLLVMGVVGMWTFQIMENVGMDIGLMPITGVPLPFMSYGTSFMLVNFMLLGLIGSVWVHSGRS